MSTKEYEKLLATRDAADFLNLGKSTLDKLRSIGGGPRFLKLGRRVVYSRGDLKEWLDGRRRETTSQTA